MARPSVDVVVPFRGGAAELEALRERLGRLELRPGDSVVVVDNTPGAAQSPGGSIAVLAASELATPAFARNRGAARGRAEWLVFLDADTFPSEDLLDRYFDSPPGERTALMGGGVADQEVGPGAAPAARYAYLRAATSQERTFAAGGWGYPMTTNAACRRSAFEEVGGFREHIRAAEDADLAYRLRAAGWELERRDAASVEHRARPTVRELIAQRAVHGAGGGWLEREYPGSSPARRRPGLVWWGVRTAVKGLFSAARLRDRDKALWALFEPLDVIVWEFGRSLPNERPLRRGRLWNRASRC